MFCYDSYYNTPETNAGSLWFYSKKKIKFTVTETSIKRHDYSSLCHRDMQPYLLWWGKRCDYQPKMPFERSGPNWRPGGLIDQFSLTHCPLVTPYGDMELSSVQRCSRLWFVAWRHRAIGWNRGVLLSVAYFSGIVMKLFILKKALEKSGHQQNVNHFVQTSVS